MSYITARSWRTTRNTYIYKYNLILLFVDGDACVEQESNWSECSRTRRKRRESELSAGTDFRQNSRTYLVLKLSHDSHAMLVFHLSQLIPTYYFLFIGQGLHPWNACFSLAMVYTHAMFVLYWSQLIPTHSLFPAIILLVLSMALCICQQHPPGS